MKMISKTSMTSTNGVTLISLIGTRERARRLDGEAAARLLDEHRDAGGIDDARDRVDDAAEVAIAVLLDQLLPGVQVDRERVRADRPRERDDARRPHRERLHGADVAEQHDLGRDVAHLIRRREIGVLVHRALRADAERDARCLRGPREVTIDGRGLGRAARHARDHERRGEPLADELGGEIDLVERELGQRLVHEVHVLEQRGLREVRASRRRDLEVVTLALRDGGRVVGHDDFLPQTPALNRR